MRLLKAERAVFPPRSAEKMQDCAWLKPERRCELEFVERTQGGRLRHALFRRLIG